MNNTKEIFIVISDYAGEVEVLDSKNTLEEAYELMKSDYEDFVKEINSEDHYLDRNSAWSDGGDDGESCNWYIKKVNVPEEKKKSPLDHVMKIDLDLPVGANWGLVETVLFNDKVISEEEVRKLIVSGEYETDRRVLVTHPDKFKNVFGQN